MDGGNQEIYPTPEYSIQLNRIYFNLFKDKKRQSIKSDIPQKIEFLSLTTLNRDDSETFYETRLALENEEYLKYLPREKDLQTQAFDADFKLGNKALMERVSSMSRRFAEWTIAEHIIQEELEDGDIIIKDGSLQVAHANESKYVEQIFNKAKEKGVIFTGLSKTCRLTTDTGYSLIASLDKFAKNNNIQYPEWCYFPIAMSKQGADHRAVIMVVKLNRDASTSFRFEILKDQADTMSTRDLMNVVSSIAEYSRDITIPGYPYGLFDAHVWARVRKEDLSNYQIILDSELAKTDVYDDFNIRIKAVSMHDRLDEL
ncbi:MAG TPA: DNA double-strand break repair nuclease NurA [Methanobacterium sp.]|nr:DNA double-strand break repair nuclease NurA [Methanobacterium sp.]